MAIDLNFEIFFDYTTQPGVRIVDFYAQWCEPCQRFLRIIPRVEAAIEGKAAFAKVDIDAEPLLKQMYELKKVPTFLFFKGGEEVFRQEGKIMTVAEIQAKVDELNV